MHNHFIIILTALTLFVCGNIQAQNAYKVSEPKDSVAKIIWNILKAEDDCISRVVAAVEKVDKNKCAKAEQFKSKTAMEFDLHIPYGNDSRWDSIAVKYQMQCYPKKNGSWIAVINQKVFNVDVDILIDYCEGITVVQYTGKKLSFPKFSAVFPKDIDFYALDQLKAKFIFSDTEMHYYHPNVAPLHFVWNGKSFETSSKVLYHCIKSNDAFEYTVNYPPVGKGDYCLEYVPFFNYFTIGSKWKGSSDGILYDGKNAIAKFDIKDEIIEGYTILHPSCGTAMEFSEDYYVAAPPVTIGTPMQYVLNHTKELPITKNFVNGKYVVTLHNFHDTKNTRRDAFLEFTSKDENSPIESIRVYSIPLTVTLMSEVESENLTNDAKTIFKALNFNEKDYGEFLRMYTNYNEDHQAVNGFVMEFITESFQKSDDWIAPEYDLNVQFQIYKVGNKSLVVLSKTKYDTDNLGDKFWYYENGQLTPAEITLPKPDVQGCNYRFIDKGLLYLGENDYKKFFIWNGNEFISE
ncbi:MAG: hypothetical protein J6Y24_14570 [Bacteroidales bacterium]|nr:hypothetical protein [Bacteroidales bacterium]